MQSEFDINQNQLPRGGLIVSMGSTPGLGYAPLVGATVKAELTDNSNLFAAGSISDLVGIGTSSKYSLGIQTAAYDNKTGIITVTTNDIHGYALNYPKTVHLKDLEFKCPTKEEENSELLYSEPNGLNIDTGLPKMNKSKFKQGVYY